MLTTLAIQNYRSLRNFVVPLGRLNVITGANGTGKSNLYRALRLLADASRNGAVAALAREGGLPSTLWAGPETGSHSAASRGQPVEGTVRMKAVGLRLGFSGDDFGYAIDFGLPVPAGPYPRRRRSVAQPAVPPSSLRQHAQRGRRSAPGPRVTCRAGADPVLAVLRPLPH